MAEKRVEDSALELSSTYTYLFVNIFSCKKHLCPNKNKIILLCVSQRGFLVASELSCLVNN